MNPRYAAVSHRAVHRCEYCHAPEAIFNLPFEVEHVIPISRDGTDEETNLALAYRSCNLQKWDYVTGIDQMGKPAVRLFHPRQDDWEEHFIVETETGRVDGRTDIGRASVACLRMNEPLQLARDDNGYASAFMNEKPGGKRTNGF